MSSADRQQDRIRLGLIRYLGENTVDPDYARRAGSSDDSPRSRVAVLVVVALFALLIFTSAIQTTRNSSSAAGERRDLIAQIEGRRALLDARLDRVGSLGTTNARLRDASTSGGQTLSGAVRRLEVSTGAVAVTGPGVTMVADDKPDADSDRETVLDKDLQRLVNGLWEAGAEAISINGQRVSNVTSIREAGASINVNYVPLRAPYTVRAIGDPDSLPSRFADSTSGAAWFDLERQVGLRLTISTARRLEVPGTDRLQLRYAERLEGEAS